MCGKKPAWVPHASIESTGGWTQGGKSWVNCVEAKAGDMDLETPGSAGRPSPEYGWYFCEEKERIDTACARNGPGWL